MQMLADTEQEKTTCIQYLRVRIKKKNGRLSSKRVHRSPECLAVIGFRWERHAFHLLSVLSGCPLGPYLSTAVFDAC
jgi:hypothetical protein